MPALGRWLDTIMPALGAARRQDQAELALRPGQHALRLGDGAAAEPRHDAPGGGCARPRPAPATPGRATPGAGADGAGAGADGTGSGGTGAGLCRSGAGSHVGPVNVGNGASGAPPAAPVALTCLKQSTARPSVVLHEVAARVGLLAHRHVQLRVVERRRLVLHARVGERLQELDEVVLLAVGEAERLQVRALLGVVEVAAAVVEVDDLAQRQRAAVVEVRRGELDVAQAGDLERAVHRVGRRGRRSGGPPTAGSPPACRRRRRGPGPPPSAGRRCCRSRCRSSGRACRARCRSRPGRRRRPRACSRSVSAGPRWHSVQSPLPWKTLRPRTAAGLSAVVSPRKKRSTGVWSETSVASYAWMASPQKSEKLYSMRS